jgi:hypothetical protein
MFTRSDNWVLIPKIEDNFSVEYVQWNNGKIKTIER